MEAQRRGVQRHAQHFHRKRRRQRAVDAGDERDASDHAFRRIVDRYQPVSRCCAIEFVDARKRAARMCPTLGAAPVRTLAPVRIGDHERWRAQRPARRVGHPDEPQDDRPGADGRGQVRIVRRQRVEPSRQGSDPAAGRAAATDGATAGPLPASGCRRRWPTAGTSRCRGSIRPGSSAATAIDPAPQGSFRRFRRRRPASTRSCAARSSGTSRTRTTAARAFHRLRHADDGGQQHQRQQSDKPDTAGPCAFRPGCRRIAHNSISIPS